MPPVRALAALLLLSLLFALSPDSGSARPRRRWRSIYHAGASRLANRRFTQLDREVCGDTAPCRFLVAGRIREQETRAIAGLSQIAALAIRTGRILVLPPVGDGHFDLCRHLPLESRHALEDVERAYGVRAIGHVAWLEYMERRRAADPTSAASAVSFTAPTHKAAEAGVKPLESTPDELCLDRYPSLAGSTAIAYGPKVTTRSAVHMPVEERAAIAASLVDLLEDDERRDMPSIIVNWEFQIPFFDVPPADLPYAPWLEKLADQVAARLGKFVSVHWRMEAVEVPGGVRWIDTVPDFDQCARDAISRLRRMNDTKTVLFMTDYPLQGLDYPHSASFADAIKELPEAAPYVMAAQSGIRTFLGAFGQTSMDKLQYAAPPGLSPPPYNLTRRSAVPLTMNLTTIDAEGILVRLPTSPPDTPLRPIADLDSGLDGVLAKLVAARASRYMTGSPRVCARRSTYAQRIVSMRVDRASSLRSVVDYFGPSPGHLARYSIEPGLSSIAR